MLSIVNAVLSQICNLSAFSKSLTFHSSSLATAPLASLQIANELFDLRFYKTGVCLPNLE